MAWLNKTGALDCNEFDSNTIPAGGPSELSQSRSDSALPTSVDSTLLMGMSKSHSVGCGSGGGREQACNNNNSGEGVEARRSRNRNLLDFYRSSDVSQADINTEDRGNNVAGCLLIVIVFA